MPIELAGWHLCRGEAILGALDIEYALSLGRPLALFTVECNSRAMEAYRIQMGETGISLPDPVGDVYRSGSLGLHGVGRHFVDVEVSSDLTRGMTVLDRLGVTADERNRTVWSSVLWSSVLHRAPPAQVVWTGSSGMDQR